MLVVVSEWVGGINNLKVKNKNTTTNHTFLNTEIANRKILF